MHVCIHVNMCVYHAPVYTYIYIYIHVDVYTYLYIHACINNPIHTCCVYLLTPGTGIINSTTISEFVFGPTSPQNTALDYGWISSGEKVPHVKDFFGSYILNSRQAIV